jgi:hypothetical protein
VKNRPTLESLPTPSDVTDAATGVVNKLPSDPKELVSAIEPYKVMARPCVDFINGLAKVTKTQELDKEERESGNTAFAAMFYQMGGQLDARVLLALWITSVSLPRSIEYMERLTKEREAAQKVSLANVA